MYLVCSFLVVLNVQFSAQADNDTLKKSDLLNVIKQNLRRNNDDYAELEKNKPSNTSNINSDANNDEDLSKVDKNTSTEVISNKMEVENNTIIKSNRRTNGDESWEFDYNDGKTQTTASAIKNTGNINTVTATKHSLRMRSNNKATKGKFVHVKRNLSRLNNVNEMKFPNLNVFSNDTLKAKSGRISKWINKKKMDKFNKFVSKNKGLFNAFLSNKSRTPTKASQLDKRDRKSEAKELLKKNALRNVVKKIERAKEDDGGKLPDPDLLDMAPAKGGRIHRLRITGRLCARHVLLPEGPKYDSNGRWYVPEHRLVARHRYHITPRPRLILPRCCNCCKKSVLGCE